MRRRGRVQLAFGAGILAFISLVAGGVYLVWQLFAQQPPVVEKKIRQVTLVKPPPPPPPEVEEPPEPEIEEPIDEPEPEPDPVAESEPDSDVPPGEDLGLDMEGMAGGDAFGLLARKGGRGLLEGRGSRFDWFAKLVKWRVEDALLQKDEVRKREYSVVVSLWIDSRGGLARYELEDSTGDLELDEAITLALGEAGSVNEPLPRDMPQPIRMRIRSRL